MIYVLTGLMASGKSTVAELLAKAFPRSVHLRGDLFRRMIVSGRADMSESPTPEATEQLNLRYRLTAHAAQQYDRAGFTVIVQDNYYGEMLPAFLALLAPYPVKTVVLCPDVETIVQREAARGKQGYAHFDPQSLYASFMKNTPRIGLWIDNSRQTPAQTVQQILQEA